MLMIILLFLSYANAYEQTQLYTVIDQPVRVYDPKTMRPIGFLEKNKKLDKVFMLNSLGEKYLADRDQKPFVAANGKIYLGVEYKNKTAAISPSSLTRKPPIKQGFRTPKTTKACCGEKKSQISKNQHLAFDLMSKANPVVAKLIEFHNSTCDSSRSSSPETMDKEIKHLNQEWLSFISKQKGEKNKKLALQARELDLVSRTVLFETNTLGTLDGKKPQDCNDDVDCPKSACERDIISLTIYNRGNYRKNNNAYLRTATNPNQYSIWNPSYTHSFMATCFFKEGLIEAEETDNDYKERILNFRKAVLSVDKIVYSENPYKHFEYETTSRDRFHSIQNIRHYYHPQSMLGCDPSFFQNQHSVKIAYIEKPTKGGTKNYNYVVDEIIVPEATNEEFTKFKVRGNYSFKEAQARLNNKNLVNVSYDLIPFEGDSSWRINTKSLKRINSDFDCVSMGLVARLKNQNSCPDVKGKHMFLLPTWAYKEKAERATFICKAYNQEVKLGGECDPRFQPISGVY